MTDADTTTEGLAELLHLAVGRPQEALQRGRRLAAESTDPVVRSYAHQAAGIVLRDQGRMPEALAELRAALRLARSAAGPDRVADVRATYGAALAMDGRTGPGLDQLDTAAEEATGHTLATVLVRRAWVLSMVGRHEQALTDLRRALDGTRRGGDRLWEARVWNVRAATELALGAVGAAERHVRRAEAIYEQLGQDLERVHAVHNRGDIAACQGDLPRALSLYDEAARRYAALGVVSHDLTLDRCSALLAAGLHDEAVRLAETAVTGPAVQPRQRAELLLVHAGACLEAHELGRATASAVEAGHLFARQGRSWWQARAELVGIRARYELGERSLPMLAAAESAGDRLAAARADETVAARLLAGRLAADLGLPSAHEHLAAAARHRRTGSAWVRAVGWLATALDREASSPGRGVLAACGHGLDALEEHQAALGSSELRALASGHGDTLARLAMRHALARGGARSVLRWSERWRATTLALAPLRPPADTQLTGQLAALRDNARRLAAARDDGTPTSVLEQERARLEHAIGERLRRRAGAERARTRLDLHRLVGTLLEGSLTLVELVEVDGHVHAVVVRGGRVRRMAVGPVDAAARALEAARFALRQTARGRPARVAPAGARLEEALLGAAARTLGDDAVVVSAPGRLHAVPWGLLPALRDRPVTSVPSASLWLLAQGRRRPAGAPVVLVAGPGLGTGGAEVPVLAARHPSAQLLLRGTATVEAALTALDGAGLAHIAAHGHFRSDSPMFSSLDLDDGPLTVHDFERLAVAPYQVVLSACDSGVMRPVGAGELLGLGAALLSLGTASIVSSVAEVDDAATVPAMLCLHDALATGSSAAEALLAARVAARGDPVAEATAASFVAIGA